MRNIRRRLDRGCGEAAAYKERTHYTPITVYWEIRQALMGDHVPMENPPFELSE